MKDVKSSLTEILIEGIVKQCDLLYITKCLPIIWLNTLSPRKDFPDVPGLYFCFCESPLKLLYIGEAESLMKRWLTHEKKKEFLLWSNALEFNMAIAFLSNEDFESEILTNTETRRKLEVSLIRSLRPPLNLRQRGYSHTMQKFLT